ncbi:metalloregulator ArsR/SmtB family transcription factor [Nocardiopsis sp. NPDC006139]|uniref:ArsR/SmtB family transcription factor n=1 Tax=Nocardiopsis sp. NPDC006139 TaxID=3154578 RepID=UPI0033A8DCFD
MDLAAEVFRLLADPTRTRIILALREAEQPVNELAEAAGKSPNTVSQHLAKLCWGRIVATRQDGTRVFYRLQDEYTRELVAQEVFQAEHARPPPRRGGPRPAPGHRPRLPLPYHHRHFRGARVTQAATPPAVRNRVLARPPSVFSTALKLPEVRWALAAASIGQIFDGAPLIVIFTTSGAPFEHDFYQQESVSSDAEKRRTHQFGEGR